MYRITLGSTQGRNHEDGSFGSSDLRMNAIWRPSGDQTGLRSCEVSLGQPQNASLIRSPSSRCPSCRRFLHSRRRRPDCHRARGWLDFAARKTGERNDLGGLDGGTAGARAMRRKPIAATTIRVKRYRDRRSTFWSEPPGVPRFQGGRRPAAASWPRPSLRSFLRRTQEQSAGSLS